MKKVVFVLITILLICGCSVEVKKIEDVKEEEKISDEYSLPDEHLFIYLDTKDLDEFLTKKTGILVISTPDNEFSEYFLNLFNDYLKELEIDKVYYFDLLNYKNLNDDTKNILNIDLDKFLNPEIIIIKKGKIIESYNLNEFIVEDTTIFNDKEFKQKLNDYYKDIICKLYTNNDKCMESGK